MNLVKYNVSILKTGNPAEMKVEKYLPEISNGSLSLSLWSALYEDTCQIILTAGGNKSSAGKDVTSLP